MTGCIDIHHHIVPDSYRQFLYGCKPKLKVPSWQLQDSLQILKETEIETLVLSLPAVDIIEKNLTLSHAVSRQINEEFFTIQQSAPSQLKCFGTVPLPDISAAIKEVHYIFEHFNFLGIQVFSNYQGRYLGDPLFEPFWQVLDQLHAVVFIHSAFPCYHCATGFPPPLLEFPFEMTRTFCHLMTSNVFSRFQNIKFIFANGGGTLPFIYERFSKMPALLNLGFEVPKIKTFKNLYFDTAFINEKNNIDFLIKFISYRHILFGTDFPVIKEKEINKVIHNLKKNMDQEKLLFILKKNYERLCDNI